MAPPAAPQPPIAALAVATFGAMIGSSFPLMVILVINDISGGLHARIDDTAWLTTLYNVGAVAGLPLVMASVTGFGRRNTMIGAGVGFVLSSLGMALAPDMPWALFWRTLQGGFGGALPVMMMLLVMTSLPPGRGQLEGLTVFAFSTTVGVGACGLLAGWLLSLGDWRALFWAQVVLGSLYVWAATTVLRGERGNTSALLRHDWPSYALLSAGLALLVVFLAEGERRFWFETWWITASLACGLISIGFASHALLRSENPLLKLSIFRKATFSWAIVLQLIFRFASLLVIWIVPQYLSRVGGLRIEQIALVLTPMCIATLVCTPPAYWITKSGDPRAALSLGLGLYALAAWLCIGLTPDWSIDQFLLPVAIAGAGQAFFSVSTMRFAVFGIGPVEGQTCGMIFNFARVFGLIGGVAGAAHLINEREKLHSAVLVESLSSVDPDTVQRMVSTQAALSNWTADGASAQRASLASLGRAASQQAFTLAYSDAFLITAIVILIGAILVWALPRLPDTAAPAPVRQPPLPSPVST